MTLTEAFSKAVTMPISDYPNLRLVNQETKSYFLMAAHSGKMAVYSLSKYKYDLFSNAWVVEWDVENENKVKE